MRMSARIHVGSWQLALLLVGATPVIRRFAQVVVPGWGLVALLAENAIRNLSWCMGLVFGADQGWSAHSGKLWQLDGTKASRSHRSFGNGETLSGDRIVPRCCSWKMTDGGCRLGGVIESLHQEVVRAVTSKELVAQAAGCSALVRALSRNVGKPIVEIILSESIVAASHDDMQGHFSRS